MSKDKEFVLTNPSCNQGNTVLARRQDLDEAKKLGLNYGIGTVITCYVDGTAMSMPWVLKNVAGNEWVVAD